MIRSATMVRSQPLPERRIDWVKGERWTAYQILGPVNAIVCHWDGQRTVACTERDCRCCHDRLPAFSKGYCAARRFCVNQALGVSEWKECILEVPQSLFDALPEGDHRGFAFQAKRFSGKKNSRVIIEPLRAKCKDVPAGFPVTPYLERLFGIRLESQLPLVEDECIRIVPFINRGPNELAMEEILRRTVS